MLPYKFYDGGCLWFVIMSHKSTALFLGMVKHGRKKVTYGIGHNSLFSGGIKF